MQHQKNVEKLGKMQNSAGVKEMPGRQSGMFYCKVCDISVPTALLLHKHMNTVEHQDKHLMGSIPKIEPEDLAAANAVAPPPPTLGETSQAAADE
jgi:hypothetical protein